MDATAAMPMHISMSSEPISGQQPRSFLAQAGDSGASPISKPHAPPWSQSAHPESLENDHVRGPASLPVAHVETESHPRPNRGHKRIATGEIKPAAQLSHQSDSQQPLNAFTGHSRTSSLDSTGNNRIAELSAQLRARLSYAAAQVEKSRQLQQQGGEGVSIPTMQDARPHLHTSRRRYNGSPEDSVVSAPELSRAQAVSSDLNKMSREVRAGITSQPFSKVQAQKLAPPVDLITGDRTKTARRRPNPNQDDFLAHRSTSRHRRHYSELEGKMARTPESRWADTLQLSSLTTSHSPSKPKNRALTPLVSSNQSPVKQRTPSQNALMEKDAIETLLFMSSPENSGYHSGSRARNSSVSVSIEAQMLASAHGSSQGSNRSQSNKQGAFDTLGDEVTRMIMPTSMTVHKRTGLEAQAGDEIDRLLDQMEVDRDSDTESCLIPYAFNTGPVF